jgi:hypothetical protein
VFTDTLTNFSMRRQIRTNLILTGVTGSADEQRAKIEQTVAGVEGVDGSVEVHIRELKKKLTAPLREGRTGSRDEIQKPVKRTEVWVSWLGGGEPEIQSAVIARLQEIYPKSLVRARTVRGMVVPQQTQPPTD